MKKIYYILKKYLNNKIEKLSLIKEKIGKRNNEVFIDSLKMFITPESFTFRGLLAPSFTPFHPDKSLNLEDLSKCAKFLKNSGIKGIIVNGSSGEGMKMTIAERKQTAEAWKKVCVENKLFLMIQVGGAPLLDVQELARHAESLGADALLCLPELFFKPKTPLQLTKYLIHVSNAAPKTPLLYYHIPKYTGVTISMGEFLNQVDGKIPTFVGIKYTSNIVADGIEAIKANGGKYAVFLGSDALMSGAYSSGFDSSISTTITVWPKFGINILRYYKEGNVEKAMEESQKLTTAVNTILKYGEWTSVMKAAFSIVSSIDVGGPREPHEAVSPENIKKMEADLKKLNLY